MKYVDDEIWEVDVNWSSFKGVQIPVFLIKNSDAKIFYNVFDGMDDKTKIIIELVHQPSVDHNDN